MQDIIKIIPDILQYFVSGYIFIFIYKNLCTKKINFSLQLIGSCVISFVWVSLINSVNAIWLDYDALNELWIIVIISILLSIIFSLIFSKIFLSKWFGRFLVHFFDVSPHSSIWRDVINTDGTYFKVYLKGNNDFYWGGSIYNWQENEDENWLCLHKPTKYNMKNEKIYSQGNNKNAYIAMKFKDVESIEIFPKAKD